MRGSRPSRTPAIFIPARITVAIIVNVEEDAEIDGAENSQEGGRHAGGRRLWSALFVSIAPQLGDYAPRLLRRRKVTTNHDVQKSKVGPSHLLYYGTKAGAWALLLLQGS
jgi:hypothetical protein